MAEKVIHGRKCAARYGGGCSGQFLSTVPSRAAVTLPAARGGVECAAGSNSGRQVWRGLQRFLGLPAVELPDIGRLEARSSDKVCVCVCVCACPRACVRAGVCMWCVSE